MQLTTRRCNQYMMWLGCRWNNESARHNKQRQELPRCLVSSLTLISPPWSFRQCTSPRTWYLLWQSVVTKIRLSNKRSLCQSKVDATSDRDKVSLLPPPCVTRLDGHGEHDQHGVYMPDVADIRHTTKTWGRNTLWNSVSWHCRHSQTCPTSNTQIRERTKPPPCGCCRHSRQCAH